MNFPERNTTFAIFFSGFFRFLMQQVKILVEMIDKLLEKEVYLTEGSISKCYFS